MSSRLSASAEFSQKSPRIILKTVFSWKISSAVLTPIDRTSGREGHQPCKACIRKKAPTVPVKRDQQHVFFRNAITEPSKTAVEAVVSRTRSVSHSRSSFRIFSDNTASPSPIYRTMQSTVSLRIVPLTLLQVFKATLLVVGGKQCFFKIIPPDFIDLNSVILFSDSSCLCKNSQTRTERRLAQNRPPS
jgi:hypothetical protein